MAGIRKELFDGQPAMEFRWGYVVYNEENRSIYLEETKWEKLRQNMVKQGEPILNNFCQSFTDSSLSIKMQDYAQKLYSMASIERSRELKLLEKMGMDPNKSFEGEDAEIYFLKNFNQIVLGEEVFNKNVAKLEVAIEKGGKNRGPSAAAFFASRYQTALKQTINELLNDPVTNYSKLANPDDPIWEEIVQKAADSAAEAMLNPKDGATQNAMYGDASAYQGLLQLFQGNKAFYNFIHSYFDDKIGDVKKLLAKEISQKQNQKTHKSFTPKQALTVSRTVTNKVSGSEQFSRMIGGFVEEFIGSGRIKLNLTEKGGRMTGGVVKSNIGATDTMTIVSWSNACDIDGVSEILTRAASQDSQEDIAREMRLAKSLLNRKKFEQAFVIHTSDKLYSMGDSFRGFDKKDNRVSDMSGLIAQSGLNGMKLSAEEIVALYLNTATQGAAFDSSYDELKESFRVIIAGVAGSMLFDDWTMIGREIKGGPTQIHVFNLDEMLVPLSYVLNALGKSFESFQSSPELFKQHLNVTHMQRPEILYPASLGKDRYGITDEIYNEKTEEGARVFRFMDYWEEQRNNAESEATFTIRFLSNFKNIISQQLAKII